MHNFCEIKRCDGTGRDAPPPPPLSTSFERKKKPRQHIYHVKENLSEIPNKHDNREITKFFNFASWSQKSLSGEICQHLSAFVLI